MGMREMLNGRPVIVKSVATVVILFVVLWICFSMGSTGSALQGRAYFTDDDGATWFIDSTSRIPPFDHHGKQAVTCIVYRCSDNDKPWVSYLSRYTASGKKLRAQQIESRTFDPATNQRIAAETEVKLPGTGDQGWLRVSNPRADAIQQPKRPKGCTGSIELMDPNE